MLGLAESSMYVMYCNSHQASAFVVASDNSKSNCEGGRDLQHVQLQYVFDKPHKNKMSEDENFVSLRTD